MVAMFILVLSSGDALKKAEMHLARFSVAYPKVDLDLPATRRAYSNRV